MNVWLCNIRCKRHYIVAFYCFLFPARWFPLPARPKETTSTISSSCMCLSILSRNLQCGSLPANFWLSFITHTFFTACIALSIVFYSIQSHTEDTQIERRPLPLQLHTHVLLVSLSNEDIWNFRNSRAAPDSGG